MVEKKKTNKRGKIEYKRHILGLNSVLESINLDEEKLM
jgi:hypothetical protein